MQPSAPASDLVLLLRGVEAFCSLEVCHFIPSSPAGACPRGAQALGFGVGGGACVHGWVDLGWLYMTTYMDVMTLWRPGGCTSEYLSFS